MSLPKPYFSRDGVVLYNADCREVLPLLEKNSIDLIATDPPYFKVKGDDWDRQWDTPAAFLSWIGEQCDEWQRILKANGSLYCFASPQMAWGVQGEIRKKFCVLTDIRWEKDSGWARRQCKEEQRSYFPSSETIIFAEHFGADNIAKGEAGNVAKCDELRGFVFEPLRTYLADEFAKAGWNGDKLNEICGTASMAGGHYIARSQWCLPTAEHYSKLQNHAPEGCLRREYEDLRREYEDLRRPFAVSADVPHTDVWNFAPVNTYPGKHPCEKPLEMMQHIVEASSRPGATVFDGFMGSGTTALACLLTGRKFVGCEINRKWCDRAKDRLSRKVLNFAEAM